MSGSYLALALTLLLGCIASFASRARRDAAISAPLVRLSSRDDARAAAALDAALRVVIVAVVLLTALTFALPLLAEIGKPACAATNGARCTDGSPLGVGAALLLLAPWAALALRLRGDLRD